MGVCHGGLFVATVEYLRRVSALERAIGVDVIRSSALEDYAAATPGVEFAWLDSRSLSFRALLEDRGPFDLAFVDSHHEEHRCRCEVKRLATSATMIALHDITNVECSGVARVWADLGAMPEWRCLEVIDQYEELGPFMGLGLAVRRGAESPNRSPRGS